MRTLLRNVAFVVAMGLIGGTAWAQRTDGSGVRINGASPGSSISNPIFTGQWTVNLVLCATGTVIQGGSPTTCTATPTLGAATTVPGTLALAKGSGGGALWTLASAATSNWTLTGAAVAPAQGDLLTFSNATGQMASVPDVATGQVLISQGTSVAPIYSANPAVSAIITPIVKPAADSTTAVQIANAAGTGLFVFDTSDGTLGMGRTPASSVFLDLLRASNTGLSALRAANSTSSTAATTSIVLDAGTTDFFISVQSQGFTGTTIFPAAGTTFEHTGAGGMTYDAHTSGSTHTFLVADAAAATISSTALNLASGVALQANGTPLTSGTTYLSAGSGMAVANVGANSCGTTTATIVGNNNASVTTVGATSATQCRIAFTFAASTEWDCAANDNTTTIAVRTTPVDTTHTDLVGTFTAGDKVTAICFPR